MSIDQRQFEQLSEMGIKLWQHREISAQTNAANHTTDSYQSVDLTALTKNQCFNDILLALNLSIGEIQQRTDHLDLGLINWYFIDEKNQGDLSISHLNNKLVTPTIKSISQSAKLKKQLWQTISQQLT